MKLRKYQKEDFKVLKKLKQPHILFGAATGYGKSAIIYNLVERSLKKGKRVLVILPRRRLVHQIAATLEDFAPSIVMGSLPVVDNDLYIASTPTLHNRLKKYGKNFLGNIDLILIDEVHINHMSTLMSKIMDLYWDKAKWIGLSATPITSQGYRLEGYDHTHYNYQTRKLIDAGWLSDVKVMVEDKPLGLDNIKLTGGDYNERDLSDFMSDSSRVSNIYKIWKKYAKRKRTMIFAVSINHANIIHSDFIAQGVAAAVVHSDMDEDVEDAALLDFKHGEVDVIINVSKLTTGFDETSVNCLILARPTKSIRLYMQIVGRGLRKHPGKKNCMILDLAGNIDQNGFPTMVRDFNKIKPEPRDMEEREIKDVECPTCGYETQMRNCKRQIAETKLYTTTTWFCPNCEEVIKENVLDNREVKRMKLVADYTNTSKVSNQDVRDLCKAVQLDNGYKDGWLYHISNDYRSDPKFKESMKLLVNKYKAGMIKLQTVLTNINKLRDI